MPDSKADGKKISTVYSTDNFNSTTKLADPVFTPAAGSLTSINDKYDLYDPFTERNPEHPNSDFGALAHLLKSSLGTGILAMPMAFKNAGLLFGAIGTIVVGIICTHCVQILVQSSHSLCRRARIPCLDFSQTAGKAFELGPKSTRCLAGFASGFVNLALVITYFSGNCVYVVFISRSIKQVVDIYYPESKLELWAYMLILLIVLIPICQIRELKYLVPFSFMANIFIVVSLGITLYYMFSEIPSPKDRDMFTSFAQLPTFFSTVIFAMEGIGVIMPVENSMRKPQHFLGCPGVLNSAMIFVICIYTVMGFFGYLKYGELTEASITLNLDAKLITGQIVQILIGLAIMFTYSLQFFVPMEITWNKLKPCFPESMHNILQIAVRTVVVCLTVVVAIVVNNLEALIGLVGAVCFSILGLLTPAIIETVTCWDTGLGCMKWKLVKNIILILFALLALVSGSYTSIKEIIHPTEHPQ